MFTTNPHLVPIRPGGLDSLAARVGLAPKAPVPRLSRPAPGMSPDSRFYCTPATPWMPEYGPFVVHAQTREFPPLVGDDGALLTWCCLGCGTRGATPIADLPVAHPLRRQLEPSGA